MKKGRILGIDVARALAVFGMILVNFKVALGDRGADWVVKIVSFFDGKASATFVFLAGIGIALMGKSAYENNDKLKIKSVRSKILKRAIFLFVVGISYIFIWPADILHYYGIYMLVILFFMDRSGSISVLFGVFLVFVFLMMIFFFDYEKNWDFHTLHYNNLWTIEGFLRNLFFNGFHPVIPWTSFMLFGYWLGRKDLHNPIFLKKLLFISILLFVGAQSISYYGLQILSNNGSIVKHDFIYFFLTNPMPPLPLYMLTGTSFALFLLSACILLCNRFSDHEIILTLADTGQLALTIYVAHVVIGMGLIELYDASKMGHYSIESSLLFAIIFSGLSVLFAVSWKKNKKHGPVEWIMRKITG